jgi:polyhydroxybutyrate depolymerase
MRWLATFVVVSSAVACWQPPDLPPPVTPPPLDLLVQRPYTLQVPLGPDGGALDAGVTGWPLLVVLHGFGSTGVEVSHYLGLDAPEVTSRFAVVLPHGLRSPPDAPQIWHPDLPAKPPWDSAYLRALLLGVLAKGPVDRHRVYVVGRSQGAHMAYRFACDSADLVTAVVGQAGQVVVCAPSRPVSALVIHGTSDEAIAYRGAPGAWDVATTWRTVDGCTGPVTANGKYLDLTTLDGDETWEMAASGCPPGVDVLLWSMNGETHSPEWSPDFTPALLGFLEGRTSP